MSDNQKNMVAAQPPVVEPDLSALTPRELAAAVTPLFVIDSRFQHQALNELVIRCEVAERLLQADREADGNQGSDSPGGSAGSGTTT